MIKIKEILTRDWAPKLTCLILATALWYLVVQAEKSPSRPERLESVKSRVQR